MKTKMKVILSGGLAAVCACLLTVSAVIATAESSDVQDRLPDFSTLKKSDLTLKEIASPEYTGDKNVEIYEDQDQNEFIFDGEGNVVGFLKSKYTMNYNEHQAKMKKAQAVSQAQIEQKAQEFLENAGVDTNQYELTDHTDSEDMQAHVLTYYHFVNGYKTSDFVMLFLDKMGAVTSYAAPNKGAFDGVTIPSIDETSCQDRLQQQIQEKYGDEASYQITEKILVKEQETFSFAYSVAVSLPDGTTNADMYQIPIGETK